MLYHLFTYLDLKYDIPGAGLFQFISFRTAMSVLFSLFIGLFIGKRIINLLKKKQIKDQERDLGLEDRYDKSRTPTMGGIIIIFSILAPVLLFADLTNIYVILLIIAIIWLGLLGFMDDYIKVFKHDKRGLSAKAKLAGQILLGALMGFILYFHPDIVVRDTISHHDYIQKTDITEIRDDSKFIYNSEDKIYQLEHKSTKTTIPFIKNNELDYALLLTFLGKNYRDYAYLVLIPLFIFLITLISNGANLTDGLDGLNAGVSAIIVLVLAIFAYVSGNTVFSNYLNIMYIPNLGELVVFIGAMLGACIGFLWYNAYPAQVFMGDTGSLTLGGLIAIISIMIRKELLIPLLCGIFVIESLSVIIQVSWFKYTRIRFGQGKRIFRMAPLHHHFQKLGHPEAKIVARFWIVGIALALLTFITLKLR